MRFIVMHKVDAKMEAGEPPGQDIIKKMGALVGQSLKEGVFLDGAGLHRSARRVRLRSREGDCTVTEGPLVGENEAVAAFAMIKTPAMADAVAAAKKVARVAGDAEIDIGPVVEPWDLRGAPRPAQVDFERFLLLVKSDAASESGAKRAPELLALFDDLEREGLLLTREALAPTATGARLAGPKGKRTWMDGPFAESKEMIAGFSILEVPGKAEAIAWADRYAAILEDSEVDVRPLA
jgi:hypothetical protein